MLFSGSSHFFLLASVERKASFRFAVAPQFRLLLLLLSVNRYEAGVALGQTSNFERLLPPPVLLQLVSSLTSYCAIALVMSKLQQLSAVLARECVFIFKVFLLVRHWLAAGPRQRRLAHAPFSSRLLEERAVF